ncbi:MAG: hypothetical protein ACI9WR_001106, partial [Paracoccaceae bacterium]
MSYQIKNWGKVVVSDQSHSFCPGFGGGSFCR